jgi:hypothetical protein
MDSVGGESTAVPLLLVDVRGEEEMAVSAIPGALHLPATEDKTQPHGWWVNEGRVPGHMRGLDHGQEWLEAWECLPGTAYFPAS